MYQDGWLPLSQIWCQGNMQALVFSLWYELRIAKPWVGPKLAWSPHQYTSYPVINHHRNSISAFCLEFEFSFLLLSVSHIWRCVEVWDEGVLVSREQLDSDTGTGWRCCPSDIPSIFLLFPVFFSDSLQYPCKWNLVLPYWVKL